MTAGEGLYVGWGLYWLFDQLEAGAYITYEMASHYFRPNRD